MGHVFFPTFRQAFTIYHLTESFDRQCCVSVRRVLSLSWVTLANLCFMDQCSFTLIHFIYIFIQIYLLPVSFTEFVGCILCPYFNRVFFFNLVADIAGGREAEGV